MACEPVSALEPKYAARVASEPDACAPAIVNKPNKSPAIKPC